VTAPLFFADADRLRAAVVGDVVVLDGAEGRHAATVRRLTVGERLELSDGAGLVCAAEITGVRSHALEARLLDRRLEPAPSPHLTVVQALAKGDRDERAVETMTEVGVDAIVPWQAARSIVRWDAARAAKGIERWRVIAREAAKQSRRSRLPDVRPLATTADVAELLRSASLPIVLHESASRPLARARIEPGARIVVVVGPEGGIDDDELGAFGAAGAGAYRLGPTVLRASTAGTAAAAVLLANSGRWDVEPATGP
jgi:16S rRNA (uracil1498-N3)-methyltransferase